MELRLKPVVFTLGQVVGYVVYRFLWELMPRAPVVNARNIG